MNKLALISLSDKTGIISFAKGIVAHGYEIVSTGGTKQHLDSHNIPTIGISELTNYPEIMDGRVKTLHPNIHGGILSVRDNITHLDAMKTHNIQCIDMVVVNLYPFEASINSASSTFDDAIENIDIGGPSMLRSAAKNHKFVNVICDASDYAMVLTEIRNTGDTTLCTRAQLAAKAFRHTARYDSIISNYLTNKVEETEPESISLSYTLKQRLRYGENPHQQALFYEGAQQNFSLAHAKQLHGKELSYNNIQDANASLQMIREFTSPALVAVKHSNPCGVSIGDNLFQVWSNAYNADPVSIFGGIITSNQEIDEKTALEMQRIFLEIIIAPSFTDQAISILSSKKNLRLLTVDMTQGIQSDHQIVSVRGGLLIQDTDDSMVKDIQYPTLKRPSKTELNDLIFGWAVAKHIKSNAIAVVKDGTSIGIGAGQMNRIASAEIALKQAKALGHTEGLILASDAFFPFDDVVQIAVQYGVSAIIQPGGSIKDEDSIQACNTHGISMIFTGIRNFKH